MAKKKYYVVLRGLMTGIFYTWEEVEPLVIGVSGASFKGFSTLEEAQLAWKHKTFNPPSLDDIEDDVPECYSYYSQFD